MGRSRSMRYTKRGEAFVVRNVYTDVKTDRVGDLMRRVSQVHRDKAVLPDFARPEIPETSRNSQKRPEIPQNVAPNQKLQDAFYAIRTLDASTVVSTHIMSYLCTHTWKHTYTHTQPTTHKPISECCESCFT